MSSRLRIGVIGLGRRWPRYRQALLALRGDVRVVGVTTPSLARAEEEAGLLGCKASGGVVELIGRDDVDAVLVTGGAWYGLWAVEQACKAGKPVLCATSPVEDEEHVDEVRARLGDTGNVHVALWPALMLLTEVLADRTSQTLGRAALLQANWTRQHEEPVPVLTSPAALALLYASAGLFDAKPLAVSSQQVPHRPEFASLALEFEGGGIAQMTFWGGPAAQSSCQMRVEADAGRARVEVPRSLEWFDEGGRHSHHLPAGPAEAIVVDRFVQAVRHDEPPDCTFAGACEALDWLRAARRGGRTVLPGAKPRQAEPAPST